MTAAKCLLCTVLWNVDLHALVFGTAFPACHIQGPLIWLHPESCFFFTAEQHYISEAKSNLYNVIFLLELNLVSRLEVAFSTGWSTMFSRKENIFYLYTPVQSMKNSL